MKVILMDIEGTTSSISFVHEVLFPYARERMAAFLQAHHADPAVQAQLEQVNAAAGTTLTLDQAARQLVQWIDEDKKIGPLKALQGMIWREGFVSGELKGHLYPEVKGCFEKWQAAGLTLAIYSSGSVQAQKLLFGYSQEGDLTPLLSAYFDTQVGHKREVSSYRNIASQLGVPPEQILFLSDIVEELDAAKAAAMQTIQSVRPGHDSAAGGHPQVASFAEISVST